jgi:hypothetical protein
VVLPALGMTPVEVWVAFGTKACPRTGLRRDVAGLSVEDRPPRGRADRPRRAVPE